MADLTKEQTEEVHEAFSVFDKGGSGKVAAGELGALMRALGQDVSAAEEKDLLSELGNPTDISKDEFAGLISKLLKPPSNPDEIIAAFKTFDKSGDGKVSVKELEHVLCNLGDRLSKDEVQELLKDAKVSGDELNYSDFVRTCLTSS